MMSKFIFAACIAALALACALHGAEGKKVYLTKLKKAVPELNHLAKTVKDKAKKSYVKQVLRHVKNVVDDSKDLSLEAIKMALDGVALAKGKFNEAHGRGHWTSSSSSSSSSSSCDACSELSELGSDVSECCQEVTTLLIQVQRLLEEEFPCDAVIAIDYVPFTIRESGKYCVVHDLVYSGTEAAITVLADNVSINFHNHSLTLTDDSAQGILVQNVNEFTLENDIIQGSSPFKTSTSAAVQLEGVNKAHIDNVYTNNTTKGIRIDNCQDVSVTNSLVRSHDGSYNQYPALLGVGIWVGGSTGVTVDTVQFEGSGVQLTDDLAAMGLFVYNSSSNVTVKNSNFTDWLISIQAASVTDFTVDHCKAVASPYTYYNLLELGDYRAEDQRADNVLIRNSTFRQPVLVPGFDGLYLLNGSNLIMENVIVDVTTGYDEGGDYYPGAIHIGCAGYSGCEQFLQYSEIYARNCIVRGANDYGLYVEFARNATFSHSEFTGANYANVLFSGGGFEEGYGTQGCQVVDSLIANGGSEDSVGVHMESATSLNGVINCQINNHEYVGVFIDSNAFANQVKGNRVFGNEDGIVNASGTSDIYFNTSCNNSNVNCVGVGVAQTPTELIVDVGSNICCDIID